MNILTITYDTIKTILTKVPSYYVSQGDGGYNIYAVGDSLFVSSRVLGHDTVNVSDFQTNWKSKCIQAASADDALILGNVANKIPLVSPRTDNGAVINSQYPIDIGKMTTFISHNFCDPTSWYGQSIRIVDEVATPDGYYKNYQLSHVNIIDMCHGKVTFEDFITSPDGYSYLVEVKVDGYVKTEQDPYFNTGGDYVINYPLGKITFLTPLTSGNVVTATYFYENGSAWIMNPLSGTQAKLTKTEIQFSADIVFNDILSYNGFGPVDIFAPQLMPGVPSGTLIPLGNANVYKNAMDVMNDSDDVLPIIPALSTSTRGINSESISFVWNYITSTSISSKANMQLKVWLNNDIPLGGQYATITLYCLSVSES